MNNTKALFAEFIGTLWLVLGGCGAAVIGQNDLVGIGLGFGLAVMAMAYAVGPISGGHFNPAVTFGAFLAGRIEGSKVLGYWIAQVLGAIVGAGILYVIASGVTGFNAHDGMASNGYGLGSPGHYGWKQAFLAEVVTTFIFITVILGVTDGRSNPALAGLVIGLTLAGLIIASGPVANASLNPARSTGPALFAQGAYIGQLWLFWVAPLLGGGVAGLVYKYVLSDRK